MICAVLLKGGHRVNDANDLLYAGGEMQWFEGKRIDNPNTFLEISHEKPEIA